MAPTIRTASPASSRTIAAAILHLRVASRRRARKRYSSVQPSRPVRDGRLHAAHHPLAVVGVKALVPPRRRGAAGGPGYPKAPPSPLAPRQPVGQAGPSPTPRPGSPPPRAGSAPRGARRSCSDRFRSVMSCIATWKRPARPSARHGVTVETPRPAPRRRAAAASPTVAGDLARAEQAHRLVVGGAVGGMGDASAGQSGQRLGRRIRAAGQGAVDPQPAAVGRISPIGSAEASKMPAAGSGAEAWRAPIAVGGTRPASRIADLDLGHDRCRQVRQQGHVARRPDPRQAVHHAQRTDGLPVQPGVSGTPA